MVLRIPISPEVETRLKAKADAAGIDLETYAAQQLERASTAAPRSLREISGTVADAFSTSGMSEDELAEFLEQEKHAMRTERHAEAGND